MINHTPKRIYVSVHWAILSLRANADNALANNSSLNSCMLEKIFHLKEPINCVIAMINVECQTPYCRTSDMMTYSREWIINVTTHRQYGTLRIL